MGFRFTFKTYNTKFKTEYKELVAAGFAAKYGAINDELGKISRNGSPLNCDDLYQDFRNHTLPNDKSFSRDFVNKAGGDLTLRDRFKNEINNFINQKIDQGEYVSIGIFSIDDLPSLPVLFAGLHCINFIHSKSTDTQETPDSLANEQFVEVGEGKFDNATPDQRNMFLKILTKITGAETDMDDVLNLLSIPENTINGTLNRAFTNTDIENDADPLNQFAERISNGDSAGNTIPAQQIEVVQNLYTKIPDLSHYIDAPIPNIEEATVSDAYGAIPPASEQSPELVTYLNSPEASTDPIPMELEESLMDCVEANRENNSEDGDGPE